MLKVADLLHIGHADYVAAKQKARQMANLPSVGYVRPLEILAANRTKLDLSGHKRHYFVTKIQ